MQEMPKWATICKPKYLQQKISTMCHITTRKCIQESIINNTREAYNTNGHLQLYSYELATSERINFVHNLCSTIWSASDVNIFGPLEKVTGETQGSNQCSRLIQSLRSVNFQFHLLWHKYTTCCEFRSWCLMKPNNILVKTIDEIEKPSAQKPRTSYL